MNRSRAAPLLTVFVVYDVIFVLTVTHANYRLPDLPCPSLSAVGRAAGHTERKGTVTLPNPIDQAQFIDVG